MTRALDLSGQRFGSWTAVERVLAARRGNGEAVWVCVCDCGTRRELGTGQLKSGHSRSCGCGSRKKTGDRSRTHGMKGTPEYACWRAMKTRCYNKANPGYRHYGARGIAVCDRWRESFDNFLKDMGKRPSAKHSIDRINVNGNYEPTNCRWATQLVQMQNTRVSRVVELRGERRSVSYWARTIGVSAQTIYRRLNRGITDPEAILSPLKGSSQ